MTRSLSTLIAIALVGVPAATTGRTQDALSLRAYLAAAAPFSDLDLAALERGRPVNKVIATRNNSEIYLLGAIRVNATPAAYVKRVTDPAQLMTLPGYRGVGLIAESSAPAEFGGFSLEPDDIEDLRACRAGDCAVQLPADRMPTVRASARNPVPATAALLLNSLFRQMAFDIVRDYRARGNAALPVYHDESRPAVVDEHTRALFERLAALSLAPPPLMRLMLDYPNAELPAGAQSLFYWERVVFGLKPTLRVTHAIAYQPAAQNGLACAVAIKQLYASHYLRAAVDFSACVAAPDHDGRAGFYLVAFKGSEQEGVTGFTGSLIRRIVVSRAKTALDGSLIRIKDALEKPQVARNYSPYIPAPR